MTTFIALVFGVVAGWFLHHFFGPQAQAETDKLAVAAKADAAKVITDVKAKL